MRLRAGFFAVLVFLICHCAKQVCRAGDVSCSDISALLFLRDSFPKAVYVANFGGSNMSVYSANQFTGALTSLGLATTSGVMPIGSSVHPNGRFLFTGHASGVQSYLINSDSTLSSIGTLAAGTSPRAPVIHPSGSYLYAPNNGSLSVSLMAISSTGSLSGPTNFGAGSGPQGAAVDPAGLYFYVVNNGAPNLSSYTIATSGALAANGGTVATGASPQQAAIDPSGKFLFVTNAGGPTITTYSIGSTGLLSPVTSITSGAGVNGLAMDPQGRYLYVSNSSIQDVTSYKIQSDGTLTALSVLTLGQNSPQQPAIEPGGRFLYVPTQNFVFVCRVSSTGTLTIASSIAGPASPGAATVLGFNTF